MPQRHETVRSLKINARHTLVQNSRRFLLALRLFIFIACNRHCQLTENFFSFSLVLSFSLHHLLLCPPHKRFANSFHNCRGEKSQKEWILRWLERFPSHHSLSSPRPFYTVCLSPFFVLCQSLWAHSEILHLFLSFKFCVSSCDAHQCDVRVFLLSLSLLVS